MPHNIERKNLLKCAVQWRLKWSAYFAPLWWGSRFFFLFCFILKYLIAGVYFFSSFYIVFKFSVKISRWKNVFFFNYAREMVFSMMVHVLLVSSREFNIFEISYLFKAWKNMSFVRIIQFFYLQCIHLRLSVGVIKFVYLLFFFLFISSSENIYQSLLYSLNIYVIHFIWLFFMSNKN